MKAIGSIDVQGLLHRCRTEGMEAITEVYKLYREEFLHFARRHASNASRELVLDAWHDAVIDFYEIALAGKYDPEKSGLKTFLFAIGKYKLFNLLKKNDRVQLAPFEENEFKNRPEFVWLQQEHLTEQEELIKKALSQLGEKCRELLVLVYYHQYSSDAVKTAMNYGNTNVVHSHKSRCLKQLKSILEERKQAK